MNNVFKLQLNKLRTFSCVCKNYGTLPRAFVEVNGGRSISNAVLKKDLAKHEVNKNYVVCTRETPDTLHFNVEGLSEDIQALFAERELEDIKIKVKQHVIKNISFNFIHENIYRCHLNMPIRKLGYNSFFQRYNDDKGLAVFFLKTEKEINADEVHIGAYNKGAFAKQAQGPSKDGLL
ncbi:uncharacterized protein LOC132717496 [Ruditapes philippinarum]|uniref:uncharacterized protein LOC132717496 n=1 Tax=Ruditapes philippinarum TaxID=129788 RepID=UPI00295A9485|nr:uncharacterized protein LOC132717496 [Ruditapes philippinarum]